MDEGRARRQRLMGGLVALLAGAGLIMSPLVAQIHTVDPNTQIDADLEPAPRSTQAPAQTPPPLDDPFQADGVPPPPPPRSSDAPMIDTELATQNAPAAETSAAQGTTAGAKAENTYDIDDLMNAAEGVFGKGAKGLAEILQRTLKEQGQPIAYITGREASGAVGIGLRYGAGTLFHKVEGERDVFWTGPSVGFDIGGNAGNSFVLIYNLYDTQELYHRYPAGEGAAYFVGGFNASYLRWKKVVLIPIRVGVGYRLGANVGYMKFSEKRRWLPF